MQNNKEGPVLTAGTAPDTTSKLKVQTMVRRISGVLAPSNRINTDGLSQG